MEPKSKLLVDEKRGEVANLVHHRAGLPGLEVHLHGVLEVALECFLELAAKPSS